MNADEQLIAQLVGDLPGLLRLLRKHRPVDGFCPACGAVSIPDVPCRPFRLAWAAALRIENADNV